MSTIAGRGLVGDNVATQQFLQLFQQHLELKHTAQMTSAVLQQDLEGVHFGEAQTIYSTRNLQLQLMLDMEQHSIYKTAVGQLFWVSQLCADIAFAVKELSRSRQQPDNEDLKNLTQLLLYIRGTIHYKVILALKASYNDKNEIQVNIESFAHSDCARCNTTRKSTSGTITSWRGTPLLHISRTQSTSLFPLQMLNFTQGGRQQ
eukprot:4938286-Amphidinium_carterae.4